MLRIHVYAFSLVVAGCTNFGALEESTPSTSVDLTPRAPTSLPLGVTNALPQDLFAVTDSADRNLACDDFFALLQRKQPTTIQETLRGVQEQNAKFLARTLYAYETKMPFDHASWVYPRPVVYGGDAKTILNFGGREHQRAAERLEVMCFDSKQKEFSGYDIVFPKEAATTALGDLSEAEAKQKFVVIKGGRGMRECAKCHQTPLRPIADTFALFPGYYGAIDDTLKDHDRPGMRPIYATYESAQWQKFESIPAKEGRYQYLSQELTRPNSDFALRVSYVNGERIVGDLARRGSSFSIKRWDFAKALLCAPRAPKQMFVQYDADTQISGSFGVLSEDSDAVTQDLFLGSYYDEMQKERRLGELLSRAGLPTPLPKEPFGELRAYYRKLLKQKDLNLDLRLSTVDVDEVLLVRELKRVTDPLGIDTENWSMVRDGGYVFENGTGGPGRVALRLILERPFMQTFFRDEPVLNALVGAREARENAIGSQAGAPEPAGSIESVDSLNRQICELISKHVPEAVVRN